MKTLYINISSERIETSDTIDVLRYDLINDFYFVLGEKILTTCPVTGVDKIKLFTEYMDARDASGADSILEQWSQLKARLFGESPQGAFTFHLPDSYLSWLKYNENTDYCRLAEKLSSCIDLDLEEFYEDSIDGLKRRVLRYLQKEDRYKEIDEIVFNDYAVVRKSAIVRAIKEKYEDIGFMSYEKWLRDNEEKHTIPLYICEKCKKNPCECKTEKDNKYCYAIEERTEKGTRSIKTYRFYNKRGMLINDGKYYIVSKGDDDGSLLHNLLVANANEDPYLYCFTPDGVFHKIGFFDLEGVYDSHAYVNKKYHRYAAEIIQNRYILYRDHQKYQVYEIMPDYQIRKISEFNQKMILVPEFIIGNYIVDIDDETINWKTGEIVNIPKYNGGRILGIHNSKPIYLVSKNWSAQEVGDYNGCNVVDESGNFLWKFDYKQYEYCSDELLIVRRGDRRDRCYGIVNISGEEIVQCDCKDIEKISDNLYEITTSNFDTMYFIVSKNKVVSYYNDDYYAVLNDTEDEYDIYSMESDKLLNSLSSDQLDNCIAHSDSEKYTLHYLYLDLYEDVLRSVSDNSVVYSPSEEEKVVLCIDKFCVVGIDYLNIYNLKGVLINTIHLDINADVDGIEFWGNGYISLFDKKKETGVWYDSNLVPHYCKDYIESEELLSIKEIIGDNDIIIKESHLTYFVRDNRCVCRATYIEKIDNNNYYCADYDVRGDNEWCIVNIENADVPIHFNVRCGYLIK